MKLKNAKCLKIRQFCKGHCSEQSYGRTWMLKSWVWIHVVNMFCFFLLFHFYDTTSYRTWFYKNRHLEVCYATDPHRKEMWEVKGERWRWRWKKKLYSSCIESYALYEDSSRKWVNGNFVTCFMNCLLHRWQVKCSKIALLLQYRCACGVGWVWR